MFYSWTFNLLRPIKGGTERFSFEPARLEMAMACCLLARSFALHLHLHRTFTYSTTQFDTCRMWSHKTFLIIDDTTYSGNKQTRTGLEESHNTYRAKAKKHIKQQYWLFLAEAPHIFSYKQLLCKHTCPVLQFSIYFYIRMRKVLLKKYTTNPIE